MQKLIVIVALTTTMGTASAGFFNNNNYNGYNQDNGLFAYNPYSFFDPRWFMQEAENFVDEFDNDDNGRYGYNGYNNSTHNFPVTSYNRNYVRGYTAHETQLAIK